MAGRDVVPLLVRTADLARQQTGVVEDLAREIDPTDAAALRRAPQVVAAVALRGYWHTATGGLPPPDERALRRMLAVAAGERRSCEVSRGWNLRRTEGRLRLERDGGGAR
ncbi:MAG: hypothetical protein R2716_02170 [Microthrixaceae bacterium]